MQRIYKLAQVNPIWRNQSKKRNKSRKIPQFRKKGLSPGNYIFAWPSVINQCRIINLRDWKWREKMVTKVINSGDSKPQASSITVPNESAILKIWVTNKMSSNWEGSMPCFTGKNQRSKTVKFYLSLSFSAYQLGRIIFLESMMLRYIQNRGIKKQNILLELASFCFQNYSADWKTFYNSMW